MEEIPQGDGLGGGTGWEASGSSNPTMQAFRKEKCNQEKGAKKREWG